MSRFGASPRTPALRSGCSGASLFGGRKESSPQLRAPPRSFGVRPRTTPLLVFTLEFVVSLPLLDSVASVYGGAHPLAMDAHSGNARGANACALDPPSRSRAHPAREGQEESRAGLPKPLSFYLLLEKTKLRNILLTFSIKTVVQFQRTKTIL